MKKVYGYIRVSTELQKNEGYSIEDQKQVITKFCKDNNLELVKIFSDEGFSGANEASNRPALSEMILKCHDENISSIIVTKMDRLARDVFIQLWIEKELLKYDVSIISAQEENLNGDDYMTKAMRQMVAVFAELEKNRIVTRLSTGKNTKANLGFKPCGTPNYGYKFDRDRKLQINPDEAEIVKMMFDLAVQGKRQIDILNTLNSQGYKTRKNNPWKQQDVYRILHNKVYIGIVLHQKQEIQGKHTPIIDMIMWDTAHNKLSGRKIS